MRRVEKERKSERERERAAEPRRERGMYWNLPFLLDDLAEAVQHAIVVFTTGDRRSGLKLTVRTGRIASVTVQLGFGGRSGMETMAFSTYTRVLTTSNGYLTAPSC